MSDNFLKYLKKEHERLEGELAEARRRTFPDQVQLARLKKMKLAIKDEIAKYERLPEYGQAA